MAWVCLAVPFWEIFDLFFSPVIFHTVKKDVPQILPFCDTSILAETVGFEPTCPCGQLDFECFTLNTL